MGFSISHFFLFKMNPTQQTTTEMIIKISSSKELSMTNPTVLYSIGAVVILCFVVLILAVIVLLMFDSKSGKLKLRFFSWCRKAPSADVDHSVINIQGSFEQKNQVNRRNTELT